MPGYGCGNHLFNVKELKESEVYAYISYKNRNLMAFSNTKQSNKPRNLSSIVAKTEPRSSALPSQKALAQETLSSNQKCTLSSMQYKTSQE